jgi:hypothetical protein
MSPESRALTMFITRFGRYCFNVLPFRITSGPITKTHVPAVGLAKWSHSPRGRVLDCGWDRAKHEDSQQF